MAKMSWREPGAIARIWAGVAPLAEGGVSAEEIAELIRDQCPDIPGKLDRRFAAAAVRWWGSSHRPHPLEAPVRRDVELPWVDIQPYREDPDE